MGTRADKGREVKQYFINVQHALYKYQAHIIDSLTEKITQLENNQKPKNMPKKMVYVFGSLNTDLTLHKIESTLNSKNRFKAHNFL